MFNIPSLKALLEESFPSRLPQNCKFTICIYLPQQKRIPQKFRRNTGEKPWRLVCAVNQSPGLCEQTNTFAKSLFVSLFADEITLRALLFQPTLPGRSAYAELRWPPRN